ncbi:putative XS domain-containing protein [Helianthus anomalus]
MFVSLLVSIQLIESEFSDSEISEHKDKPYAQLRNGTLKVKYPGGIFKCLFCAGKKKQNFKYKDLHQHASGVSKGSSNRSAKQKANHLALTLYLENELADEAEKPVKVVTPITEENKLFCWPWTGIMVNIVKESDDANDFENTEYWLKRFSKYKPEDVELLWDAEKRTAKAFVRFNNGLIGSKNAMVLYIILCYLYPRLQIQNDVRNNSLHMASIEQEKADEGLLRLIEEQKEALKKVVELERQLAAKQQLEMEIAGLKGKVKVLKHLGDEDNTAVLEQVKKMNDELEAKMEEMGDLEDMNQTLVVKEHESNNELQDPRKDLIKCFLVST